MRFNGGVLVSEGLAYEKVYLYRHEDLSAQHVLIEEKAIESEIDRFNKAVLDLVESSQRIKYTTEEEKSLIDVHIELLSDIELKNGVENLIREKLYNAPWAVDEIIKDFVGALISSGDEYLSERAADFEDVKNKLISKLSGESHMPVLDSPSILISDYLLPSEVLALDRSFLKGIVLELGGRTSHVAILARSLGIPAILALNGITYSAKPGDMAIINGLKSEVIINPSIEELSCYRKEYALMEEKERTLLEDVKLPSITKDGHRIRLFCNIEGIDGIASAISSGAEGIGLFRTEFLFLQKDLLLDESTKEEIYKKVAVAFKSIGPVTIRTMDLGGDKFPADFGFIEDNPFLGNRSIRYSMDHKDLFKKQLVSILRASSNKNVNLMFPFISGPDELSEVLELLEEVKKELRERGIPFDEKIKVGTMIEVPSAAITSDLLSDMVDFMSIGTNDLIQYTIAVDRGNSKVARLYNPLHPAVLRLLKLVADNCQRKGKSLSICGEMAGSVEYLPLLIGLGFSNLSMAAHSILEIKNRVRQLDFEECRKLADEILMERNQESIKSKLEDFNGKTGY